MTVGKEWTEQSIQRIIDGLEHKPGAMLPILHAIQNEIGYIPEKAVAQIAESLLQTRAEVHGVISFYHHFRTTPPGKHTIEICRAEACQAMGCRSLEAHAKQSLGIDYHQTTANRQFSLEPVYCLGNCATGPSIRIDDDIHGRVSLDRFDELVASHQQDMKEVG
ncbi:formate dehydrogenase subunit gamma [Methylophaga marina]|uniref:NADH-quinone oxidoreductase subunit E n=1 Tax=Methylophaga marina TaxID=45495 RepID=A0ABN0T8S4_9GAMM|nr:formate dehydrogenase subunit gamma [Methylophaga marina]BDZ72841.1 formate dehydrogenase subunit gamma [Methylophaga marina]